MYSALAVYNMISASVIGPSKVKVSGFDSLQVRCDTYCLLVLETSVWTNLQYHYKQFKKEEEDAVSWDGLVAERFCG